MRAEPKAQCQSDLKNRILTLGLAPGSDLDEAGLSDFYGISRTPLREVLQRLAGAGYVDITAKRGAQVASLDITTLRTFFQTAPMIYANIAQLAAENRTAHQLDHLRTIQSAFEDAVRNGDASGAALHNHAFHQTIGLMAHNPYLMACLERLLIDHTRLGQTFYKPAAAAEKNLIDKAVTQHNAMITAIEAQESALAIDLTLQHWDLSRDQIDRFVRPDPLPIDVVSRKDHQNAI